MSIALGVIDMQNDFVLPGAVACVAGAQATIPVIRHLLDHARGAHWPVFHIIRQHTPDGADAEIFRRALFAQGRGICVAGSPGAQVVPELAPLPGEDVVIKTRFSGFFGTDLDARLRSRGVSTLVLAGTQYPNCVRGTAVDAMSRDYRVIVVTDACSAQTDAVASANIADMTAMGILCMPLARLSEALPKDQKD
jgi:Amidases related to nicotinamidase